MLFESASPNLSSACKKPLVTNQCKERTALATIYGDVIRGSAFAKKRFIFAILHIQILSLLLAMDLLPRGFAKTIGRTI